MDASVSHLTSIGLWCRCTFSWPTSPARPLARPGQTWPCWQTLVPPELPLCRPWLCQSVPQFAMSADLAVPRTLPAIAAIWLPRTSASKIDFCSWALEITASVRVRRFLALSMKPLHALILSFTGRILDLARTTRRASCRGAQSGLLSPNCNGSYCPMDLRTCLSGHFGRLSQTPLNVPRIRLTGCASGAPWAAHSPLTTGPPLDVDHGESGPNHPRRLPSTIPSASRTAEAQEHF